MKLLSPSFKDSADIPTLYTCDGDNINPALHISDVPKEAKSLVLIMDDPDVPEYIRKDRMYVHWVIFNMPADSTKIAENSQPPGIEGKNTSGQIGYVGPCPPDKKHRYFFKLYALDTMLDLKKGAMKEEVEKKMQGHILSHTQLMGQYDRLR